MKRTLTINLPDADCERINKLCGEHNITVATLIENFIGDLVGGTYTNGSDERDFARAYFERCWFGMYPEKTLLSFLLSNGYDVYEDLVYYSNRIDDVKRELEQSPIDVDMLEYLEDIKGSLFSIRGHYLEENPQADWDKECEKVLEWWRARLK